MLKTLKVPVSDLDIGMFVSGLDRPWLGTPFFTQGFFVESAEDIERLGKFCNWVLVDSRRTMQSKAAATTRRTALHSRERRPEIAANERRRVPIEKIFEGHSLQGYAEDSPWEQEHPRAREALGALVHDIDELFAEVESGEKLNAVKLRKSVEPVVDSISRNPDACLWVARLKQHDRYTYQHSLSASVWAVALGRQLGLPRHDLRALAMGCLLMDVGKLRIDPSLLQAEHALSTEEMGELASHVDHGIEILREAGIINEDVLAMVAYHHERYDGSGYPNGLSSESIPPFARIAGIVDTYDAMTSERSYAAALAPAEAIKALYKVRDCDFQAELVEAFIQAIGIYPAGTLVELSSGEVGVVVAEYRSRRLRPKVLLLLDSQKRELARSRVIDLQEIAANGERGELTIKRSLESNAFGIDLTQLNL